MRIVLKQKAQSHDTQPLVVMFDEEINGKMIKRVHNISIGGHLDLADQTAYEVMAKYKGLFVVAGADSPVGKSLKTYDNKSTAVI